MPISESTLRIPQKGTKVNFSEQTNYCRNFHTYFAFNPGDRRIVASRYKGYYCGGCDPAEENNVKYKLFKNKIVYLCKLIVLSTKKIPQSLQGENLK